MVSVVYKLEDVNGDVYFGSKTGSYNRLSQHKGKFNSCLSRNLVAPVKFIVLHEIKEIDKNALRWIERGYMSSHKCINKNIPIRSVSEIATYRRDYYIKNKAKEAKYNSDYYTNNIEKIKKNKRLLYLKNRDSVLLKRKQYQIQKDNINKQLQ